MNLAEWKHKRILKGLGPLEPQHVRTSERFEDRKQPDAFTGWVKPCTALTWITAGKVMPFRDKAPISRLGGAK